MNSKLEESNKKKKRNALAEKILLEMINHADTWMVSPENCIDNIEDAFKLADAFIEYSNK